MGQAMGQGIKSQTTAPHVTAEPWIQRVESIYHELEMLSIETLDRAKFMILMGIDHDKAATRLMVKFGAAGKPLIITRARLHEALGEYWGEDVAAELARRRAFAERFVVIRREYVEQPPVLVVAPPQAATVGMRALGQH